MQWLRLVIQHQPFRRWSATILCLLVTGLYGVSYAAQNVSGEHQVKAAFLYNFAKFVRWPDHPVSQQTNAPIINLCLIGKDPFGPVLEVLQQKQSGFDLNIHRNIHPTQASRCNILYIGDSKQIDMPALLQRLSDKPVLTVSDADDFAETGGMIGFVMHRQRVRLEINPNAAYRAQLKIDPALLEVAHRVVGGG